MRKSLIITIAAALLLAAVLCTAGCVEAPSDPIVGDWVAETDTSVSYAVFENGGTGTFYFGSEESSSSETESGYSESSSSQTATISFNWKADGGSAYTLVYADGATETAVLNAEHGLMTIGEVIYEKYPSGYSGAAEGGMSGPGGGLFGPGGGRFIMDPRLSSDPFPSPYSEPSADPKPGV